MSGSRLPPLPEAEAATAAAEAGVPAYMAELKVFQVLLLHPRLARAVNDLLATLLFDARLAARLRELAIMRIGWLCGCDYEWAQHWRIARGLGVSEADLLAVREGPSHPSFGPSEQAVLAATDEIVTSGSLSPGTWDACVQHLGSEPDVLLELVAAIATWRMVASVLLSLEVPLDDGLASWAPDGRGPAAAGPQR